MIFSLRTVYIFEHAETLLELPPLPLTFDLHLFLRAQAALQEALGLGGISKNHYLACVTDYHPHEEELFMSYLELYEDDSYTVSPLACILFEANSHGPTTVKLGPHARAVYDALRALSRVRFETLVAHVAQPLWRTWHIHRFPGTDLETYKPGNVSERLAGFTGADAFYLCEYYPDHDSYEADLPKRRRIQYRPERFTDWTQPDSLLKVERHFNSECARFYAQLCEKERALTNQIEAAVQRETRLLREKIKDLENLDQRRNQEIAALRRENAALRAALVSQGHSVQGRLVLEPRVIVSRRAEPGRAVELPDIRTRDDNTAATDFILETVRSQALSRDGRVIASVAGGRKTMNPERRVVQVHRKPRLREKGPQRLAGLAPAYRLTL